MRIGYGLGQRSVMIAMGPGIRIMPAGKGRGEGENDSCGGFQRTAYAQAQGRMRKRRGSLVGDGLVG